MNRFQHIKILLDAIYKKSPLQRKKIEKFLNSKDESFKQEFEGFLADYVGFLDKNFPIHHLGLCR